MRKHVLSEARMRDHATKSHFPLTSPVVLPCVFSEAACTPVSVSIIADLYPTSFRSAATGIFNWGIYFGYGFSYLVGVYATEADIAGLSWRFAYIVSGSWMKLSDFLVD